MIIKDDSVYPGFWVIFTSLIQSADWISLDLNLTSLEDPEEPLSGARINEVGIDLKQLKPIAYNRAKECLQNV